VIDGRIDLAHGKHQCPPVVPLPDRAPANPRARFGRPLRGWGQDAFAGKPDSYNGCAPPLCHSDQSLIDNEWGISRYPFM
jgi:hypothetical protein